MPHVAATGFARYNESEWADLKRIMPDMAPSYAAWKRMADDRFRQLKASGMNIMWVDVTAEMIKDFIKKNPGMPHGQVRTSLAAKLAHDAITDQ